MSQNGLSYLIFNVAGNVLRHLVIEVHCVYLTCQKMGWDSYCGAG